MRLKDSSISLDGLQAPMLRACAIVDEIYLKHARHEVTLTSAKDGKHSDDSLHYDGLACDYRNRDLTPGERVLVFDAMKRALPAPFEVLDESSHFHVEYDQKG